MNEAVNEAPEKQFGTVVIYFHENTGKAPRKITDVEYYTAQAGFLVIQAQGQPLLHINVDTVAEFTYTAE